MARNRQRAKQRQAERRARRLGEQRAQAGDGAPGGLDDRPEHLLDDPTTVDPSPAVPPDLAVGAPPTDEGRSDTVIEDEPPLSEEEALEEIDDWEVEDEEAEAPTGAGEAGYEVRGRRGREDAEAHRERPRVVQFLIAVWAELQRVQ